ncbi:transcription factor BIM2-like isoform X2 [Juglans microcarpa x Juglans regia]|uniref:transcription factor BIM2-like isoform X2 n=1 Tax=Juglans microcarpa x Juglans regia TaxID=2249226 RepID=UPI001B7ECDBE|nr:transcription factor BIM2-like isoform X2 [Juglans microcarpa x Juglans regia]
MVKSPKSHDHNHDEFEECDVVGTNGSCSRSGDEKSKDQKTTAHRSKHSETEQRRRSKINERFQILRDIIPQNDKKRDKASFLLEVIEYIQFLQDKLNMYEGQYHGWSPEPKKLIPWRNTCGLAESIIDHSQVINNGFGLENNIAPPALLTNAQNTPESELGTAAVYKALNHPTGSATPAFPSNLQMKPNIFDPVVRGGVPAWSLQESISDAENMPSQPQSQWWHARPYPTEDAAQNNMSEHELAVDSGSVSISSAYSQEILNSLTQELQSSGVDLSQANISVQINVGKSANIALNAVASNSKVMADTAVGSCHNDSGLAHKRLRTEES